MLVTDLVNVRYLSGFTGSNAALLVRVDDATPVLATDGRYRTQAPSRRLTPKSSSSGPVGRIWRHVRRPTGCAGSVSRATS